MIYFHCKRIYTRLGCISLVAISFELASVEKLNELTEIVKCEQDIEVIYEKNFNGSSMVVEIFINSIPAVALITPIIIEKIRKKNLSKLEIDGDKIIVDNVSEELIKDILNKKLNLNVQIESEEKCK